MGRGVFRAFFEDLFAGDPIVLIPVIAVLVVLLVVGIFWIKVVRERKREEELRKKKYGIKPAPTKKPVNNPRK